MLDIWFVAGLALGTIVTGFCAIGSFSRGGDSVGRRSWSLEHEARKRAFLASRAVAPRARANADGPVAKRAGRAPTAHTRRSHSIVGRAPLSLARLAESSLDGR